MRLIEQQEQIREYWLRLNWRRDEDERLSVISNICADLHQAQTVRKQLERQEKEKDMYGF